MPNLLLSKLDCRGYHCRQNEAMGHVQQDVDVLNTRVLGANRRARRLLGK